MDEERLFRKRGETGMPYGREGRVREEEMGESLPVHEWNLSSVFQIEFGRTT